ncbi:MAG: glucose-1-phosphate thymidylyltransferase [Chloroflexota bacterium]
MKAIVLAAGQGTRLYPVTHTMPKPLVPVANKRLLQYALDNIKNAGITDIGIVVSPGSPIEGVYGDGSDLGVNLTYIVQEEQLGLAHAAGICRDFIGDDDFAMFLGDNIFQDNMANFIKDFQNSDAEASIALAEVPDPSRFGIAVIEDGVIKNTIEKPANPPSNLAIVGIYLFRKSVFEAIDTLKPSARGEYEITDAIQKLITDGKDVKPYTIQGWFIDAGKPKPIIQANQLVLEEMPWTPAPTDPAIVQGESEVGHRVIIGDNSKIIDSVVRGPVVIGDNVTIRNSFVGPYTAIGDNSTIEDSGVEASIIMGGVTIKGVPGRIEQSVIANDAQIISTGEAPHIYRFVLAEKSIVEV